MKEKEKFKEKNKTSFFNGFESGSINVGNTDIFIRRSGSGEPLLLLHGFPQTHLMWRSIASRLAQKFTFVCADLTGYGKSGCPDSTADQIPYSKRAIANNMVSLMAKLGFGKFSVAGHDRGGRVAYRMALDHPEKIACVSLMDIIPTTEVWERANSNFSLAYWPWSFMAQPYPLPERLISAAPEAIIDDALTGWGSPASVFSPEIRTAYIEALQDARHVHAICEEYRAAAKLDREHDNADRERGRLINCPVQILWSAAGPLGNWSKSEGGPLGIWQKWAKNLSGTAINGGHFFPEETPEETLEALIKHLSSK